MIDSSAAEKIKYSDLIKEVYIDPIRTVVVIDDEYPSLDGMIAKQLNIQNSWNGTDDNLNKAKEILDFCRRNTWLVDIHDGKNLSTTSEDCIAPHLCHSDLLILDYHLDDDGQKAINIIKSLAKNNHFNMVIVYTNGDPKISGAIDTVAQDIALGLIYPDTALASIKNEDTQKLIEEWEDSDSQILSKLSNEITTQSYLKFRTEYESDCAKFLEGPEGKAIIEHYNLNPCSFRFK